MEGRKIALIYIDAGGGHRAAAAALCEVIREQRRPWQVEMLSIQDLRSVRGCRMHEGSYPPAWLMNVSVR